MEIALAVSAPPARSDRDRMLSTRRRLIVVVTFAAAIAVCTSAAAQVAPSAGGKNFLWKVQSGTAVLYLAGSVHALTADVYPLSPAFQRAFDASGVLVEEIDLAEADPLSAGPALFTRGIYQDGRTFDSVVSKRTAALVEDRLKNTLLPFELIRPMKPWMVSLMLTVLQMQGSGLDASLGLDKHFYDKASAAGKMVIGLETAESQIERLDRMPEAVQEQMLLGELAEMDAERGSLNALVGAWQRGDAGAIERLLLGSFQGNPAAYASLITERNRNWLPQLDACFRRPSPCFVIVGAAHLVGPEGLLALLQRKGYRIEQQ